MLQFIFRCTILIHNSNEDHNKLEVFNGFDSKITNNDKGDIRKVVAELQN